MKRWTATAPGHIIARYYWKKPWRPWPSGLTGFIWTARPEGGRTFLRHCFPPDARGRLISLDQDPDAVEEASRRLKGLPARVLRANFTAMASVLREEGIASVDGILLDIGVSSHQLDTPERGFSYHADAPLDMRMSQEGTTAADLVNTWDENALAEIFTDTARKSIPASLPGRWSRPGRRSLSLPPAYWRR